MPKRNIIWAIAILAATAGVMWVMRSNPYRSTGGGRGRYDPLAGAVGQIEEDYYTTLDEETLKALRVKAIAAIADSLDEFSTYIPPDKFQAFEQRMGGFIRGSGLRTRHTPGEAPVVTAVLYRSPADQAKIRVGKLIVRINSRPAAEIEQRLFCDMLNPPLGESVSLVLRGPGELAERAVTLTSDKFPIESVTGLYRLRHDDEAGRWAWMLDADAAIAYVRVREFVNDTVDKFRQTLRTAGAVKGLVLDLRGNPGGKSNVAIELADMFLSKGLIVRTLGRGDTVENAKDGKHSNAHGRGTIEPIPLVVLVDEQTSSGAEVVAGALWAHHRAVLVGVRTRGKGCVQTMIELPGGLGLLNLTTSQFVFARGGIITRTPQSKTWGIAPHVTVRISPADQQALARLRAEAQRPPEAEKPTTGPAAPKPKAPLPDRLLEADYQLARALGLLRRPVEYERVLQAERLRSKQEADAARAAAGRPKTGQGDE